MPADLNAVMPLITAERAKALMVALAQVPSPLTELFEAEPRLRATLRAAVPTLTESDADELAATWISGLSDKFALDREIPSPIRSLAAGYWSNDWGSDGRFERTLRAQLPRILGIAADAVTPL